MHLRVSHVGRRRLVFFRSPLFRVRRRKNSFFFCGIASRLACSVGDRTRLLAKCFRRETLCLGLLTDCARRRFNDATASLSKILPSLFGLLLEAVGGRSDHFFDFFRSWETESYRKSHD